MSFYEDFIYIRNILISNIYKYILKPIFFLIDPEKIHDTMINAGKLLGKFKITRFITSVTFNYKNHILEQNIFNLRFKNPIGLAAGFDKNAELINIIPDVGFGFMEIGSITGEYCEGNPKPRLWRLIENKSLRVYYGLKNNGAEKISKNIQGINSKIPLGINIAMTNCQSNLNIDNAILDYKKAFEIMKNHGDYITVNISCPNTLGGQPFMQIDNLNRLFNTLDQLNTNKKIFIKLSPDMSDIEIDNILEILNNHRIHGIICSNLTKKFNNENDKGGLSGKAVWDLSNHLLSYIYKKTHNKYILIGLGGVFTAKDAYEKIKNGASLIQIITGMIYEGPQSISEINRGLVKLLKADGYKNIREAIGANIK